MYRYFIFWFFFLELTMSFCASLQVSNYGDTAGCSFKSGIICSRQWRGGWVWLQSQGCVLAVQEYMCSVDKLLRNFSLACVAIRRGFGFSGIGTIDVFVKYELEVSDTHQTNKTKHRQLPPAFLWEQLTSCQPAAFPGLRLRRFCVLSRSLCFIDCLWLSSYSSSFSFFFSFLLIK